MRYLALILSLTIYLEAQEVTKISNDEIKIVTTETKTIETKHNIRALKDRKENLMSDIAKLQLELDKTKILIQQCKDAGVE
jgi:hypothetical protein